MVRSVSNNMTVLRKKLYSFFILKISKKAIQKRTPSGVLFCVIYIVLSENRKIKCCY